MKNISKKPRPYVCECDRGLPKKEQTVFWLIAQKVQDAVTSLGMYASGMETNMATGQDEFNENKWLSATKNEFMRIVSNVTNCHFSEDYPELNKQGYMDIKPEDLELKEKLFYDLTEDILKEITQAAKRNKQLDKKKLN